MKYWAEVVILLCIVGMGVALVALAVTVSKDIDSGRPWIRDCAEHRPLDDCRRDWKAMNGP